MTCTGRLLKIDNIFILHKALEIVTVIKTMNFKCIKKMNKGGIIAFGGKGYIKRNVRKAVTLKYEPYRGMGMSIEYCL